MGISGNEKFEAFDFNYDDETIESVSERFVEKFSNSNSDFLDFVPTGADHQMHNNNIDEQTDDFSDEDGSVKTSCSSPISSDLSKNEGSLEDPASHSFFVDREMEAMNVAVVLSPDYLQYRDRYCTESLLTFSCSCIMLEGSNSCGDKEHFCSEWKVLDVTCIESQWCGKVETAHVKICVRETTAVGAEDSYKAPDIVELKFAVYDRHWPQKREKILSLSARYKAVWDVAIDSGMAREADYAGQNIIFSSEHYFFDSDKHFEEVVYPKGDPDAVSISKRDVELLQPETFINDTLIDFYIKYLKNRIQPEDQHRFHFFNSFFFRKLADLDKDPSSASEGRAAFLRVRKWTRKVNLFEKDYIFIPVNFSLHWSLIVICHLGELTNFKDGKTDDSHKVPCILHMDSIKGSHNGLKNLVQSYLWEEWKERQVESSEDLSSKFLNLRFVPLELPQQENSFDCGLFLLHYVERFLEEAPVNFSPFTITKLESFLSIDWFPPSEASLKRARIQKLILELLDDHSPEIPQATYAVGLEFLSKRRSPTEIGHNNSFFSPVDQGIEMKLLERTPPHGAHFVRDQGLVFRELFEPGTTAGTFSGGHYGSFDQHSPPHTSKCVMSPIEEEEEEEETQERIVFSPSRAAGCWAPAGLTFETCSTSYPSKNSGVLEPFSNLDFSIRLEEHNGVDSSPRTSSFGSHNSFELGLDLLPPTRDFASQNQQEETDEARLGVQENVCGSCPSEREDILVIEDSQETEKNIEVKENEESLSYKVNSPAMTHEEKTCSREERNPFLYSGDNSQLIGDDSKSELDENQHMVQLSDDDSKSELDEHNHIAKRPRLMLSAEG